MAQEKASNKVLFITFITGWTTCLLWLSGFVLWGALLGFVLMIAIGVLTTNLPAALPEAMFGSVVLAAWFAVVVLGVYACIERPWGKAKRSKQFVIQLGVAMSIIVADYWVNRALPKAIISLGQSVKQQWLYYTDPVVAVSRALRVEEGRERRNSDVAIARSKWRSNESVRLALGDARWVCDLAMRTDTAGLAFLLTEVWTSSSPPCPYATLAGGAITRSAFENLNWFVARMSPDELPPLALRLFRHAESNHFFADDDSLLPYLQHMLTRGMSAQALVHDRSLLSFAASGNHIEMSRLLLQYGANANEVVAGYPLFFYAKHDSSGPSLLEVFLDVPTLNLAARDQDGRNALEHALVSDHSASRAAVLLKAGFSVPKDRYLLSQIRKAALWQTLFAHGLDPRNLDAEGNTLLAYVVGHYDFVNIATFLVQAGVPLNQPNKYQATILNYLERNPQPNSESIAALKALGATAGKEDKRLWIYDAAQKIYVRNLPYQIRFADGETISGVTDVLGNTQWIPDGRHYELVELKDK